MRRLVLSLLIAAGIYGSTALAADMPDPRPDMYLNPAVLGRAPAFTWTGAYIGVNGGYGSASLSDTSGLFTDELKGGFVGGQLGANWQVGSLVLGVEGDYQKSWQELTQTGRILGVTFTLKEEVPWFGTARVRAGFAFDRALIYVTGGAAWINLKLTPSLLGITVSSADTKTAWTAGGGLEWMFVDRWSAKVEYLYIDTGDTTANFSGLKLNGRLQDNLYRFGVNYHF